MSSVTRILDRIERGERGAAEAAHHDLYERSERISLRIRGGMLEIGALQRPGFGYDLPIRVDERSPVP